MTDTQDSMVARVLLVEDSPSDARLLHLGLGRAKGGLFEVTAVESLQAALAALRERRFDVALLDLGLPDSSGFATFQRVQEQFPYLPVVVMTGADNEAEGAEAIRLGVQDYLTKGRADALTVARAIRYAIERKRAEQSLRELNEMLEQRVAERTAESRQLAVQLRALAVELTQAEQLERRRLAQVLHDHIQQLLVACKIQVGITTRTCESPKRSEAMERINSLIQEAIEACRSLTVELSPPVLHQAGLGAGLEWLAHRLGRQSQFEVEVSVEPGAEPQKEEVRLLLFDCARELLLNALKHSGVRRSSVFLAGAPEGWTRLTVEDEGMGFDPRAISAGAEHGGFGLFSIQERLRHMGGRVEIESAPGRGARICILMPPAPAETPAEPEAPAPLAAAPAGRGATAAPKPARAAKIRVLLADDHKILRQGLASLIKLEQGIEIVGEAADGAEAVELARRLHPDVVIMDVTMPRLSGVEATRIISAELPHTRVIALSMHSEADMARAMREAGAVEYLAKGGPSEPLIAAIRACAG